MAKTQGEHLTALVQETLAAQLLEILQLKARIRELEDEVENDATTPD